MFLLIAHSLLSIQRVFQTSQKTFVSNVCDDSVTLVWEPPSSELEAHLLAYTLEIVRYGESSYTVCAEKIHECSWTVDNLCLGEKLRFRLKCVNSIGTSDPSSPTAWIIVENDQQPPIIKVDDKYAEGLIIRARTRLQLI